ncbi:hypothetical protein COLO4_32752 [Corchorus olitorius]|uniref:Uncharacterized protein n=1 Tax=Corchorus olitorius TaxID=93759 RepID=A0A1R3GY74_9ROSI|nr:hypothetical protein COLO4_32752 [Corchorus olitorius]
MELHRRNYSCNNPVGMGRKRSNRSHWIVRTQVAAVIEGAKTDMASAVAPSKSEGL